MRSSPAALAAFEVAVGGRSAALAGRKFVRVHRQAHAAAGLAPLEARIFEDAVESFFFGLLLHKAAAGYYHRVLAACHFVTVNGSRRGTQVRDPRIGTRTNKHAVQLQIADRFAAGE